MVKDDRRRNVRSEDGDEEKDEDRKKSPFPELRL